MFEFLQRFFGFGKEEEASSKKAKERLKLVLVHDRASLSPEVLDNLKEDLIKVISTYLDIDDGAVEVNLNREDETIALVASIPVLKVKRSVS